MRQLWNAAGHYCFGSASASPERCGRRPKLRGLSHHAEYDLGSETIGKCIQAWNELCRAEAGEAPLADARSAAVSRLADQIRERLGRLPESRRLSAANDVIEGILYALMELLNIELKVTKDRLNEPGSFEKGPDCGVSIDRLEGLKLGTRKG
jgi:hypothetical protein